MDLEALREKRSETAKRMQTIMDAAESDGLTDEQAEEFDQLEASFSKLDQQIERGEKAERIQGKLNEREGTIAGQQQLMGGGGGGIPGPEAVKDFESFGEFMHAVRFKPNDQRLEFHEPDMRGEQRMDDGGSGGFAVPRQFVDEMLRVDTFEAGVRPRARVIPAGSPPDASISMPSLDQSEDANLYGGVEVNWIGEGSEKPETDTKIREVTLTPQEVAAHVLVTDKLLRNWQAAGSMISGLLQQAIMSAEDDAFINGDGVGKPRGFIQAPCAINVNRETANQISYEDIIEMESRLLAGAQPVWVVTRRVVKQLRGITSPEGHLIWGDGQANAGIPPTLLGYPVVIVERGRTLGDKGDISLVDLSYYLIKDGSGPFVAASEHVHFKSNKTVIKAFWNVDGQSWMHAPIKKDNGETQSPFVLLDVPS